MTELKRSRREDWNKTKQKGWLNQNETEGMTELKWNRRDNYRDGIRDKTEPNISLIFI